MAFRRSIPGARGAAGNAFNMTGVDKNTYEVFLHEGLWHVTTNGRARIWGTYTDRTVAIREAKMLADAVAPSEVIVHAADGSIRREYRHRKAPSKHK